MFDGQEKPQGGSGDEPQNKAGGFFTVNLSQVDSMVQQGAGACLLYTSPSPRDRTRSRMPSSA